MQTVLLRESRYRTDQTNFQADRNIKMTGSLFPGRVLSRRYKILGIIGGNSFKAHDLALDQTVTVRQAILTDQYDGDTWRQKLQQLVLVRDPNFLNVLDVICAKSGDFVITERSRGPSIAEILSERLCFNLEEVLQLMTPLAGALDFAAGFACCSNPISLCSLFAERRRSFAHDSEQRSVSDWPPFHVKLDIWELARPRESIAWPSFASKTQSDNPTGLAVKQAALLTYGLLCGDQIKRSGVQDCFKSVNELSDAANRILYDGLNGSPLFGNSESFFRTLRAANRSVDENSGVFQSPALQTREYSLALLGTEDVMKRFNRDTRRLATRVLGAVVFAVLVLAGLVQERHPKAADLEEESGQAKGEVFLNPNPVPLSKIVDLNGRNSNSETALEQATSVGPGSDQILRQENLSPSMETATSTQIPVLMLTPEKNDPDVRAHAIPWSPARWRDITHVIRPKIANARYRPLVRLRPVNVKQRLIALWHQILGRREKSRGWTAFSNSSKAERKGVGYTVETTR